MNEQLFPQLFDHASTTASLLLFLLLELNSLHTSWEYMRDKAIALGVQPEALLVEKESLHTRENAEYALVLLKERNVRRVILVTSPFHQ